MNRIALVTVAIFAALLSGVGFGWALHTHFGSTLSGKNVYPVSDSANGVVRSIGYQTPTAFSAPIPKEQDMREKYLQCQPLKVLSVNAGKALIERPGRSTFFSSKPVEVLSLHPGQYFWFLDKEEFDGLSKKFAKRMEWESTDYDQRHNDRDIHLQLQWKTVSAEGYVFWIVPEDAIDLNTGQFKPGTIYRMIVDEMQNVGP